MSPHVTHWTPGIVVAAIGFVVSLVVFFLSKDRSKAGVTEDVKLADLNERLQQVVDQLRELETERHMRGESYETEKARLEQEGAAALRARDEYIKARAAEAAKAAAAQPAATAAPAPARTGFWARHPELKGALWGAGIVCFIFAAGWALTNAERERGDGEMTGMRPPNDEPPATTAQASQSAADEDPHFKAFLERAKTHPEDADAAAYVAHVLIRDQKFDEAEKLTAQALAADPFHVESRIHRAVLRATEGHMREAIDDLGKIARTWPESYEALLFRGAIALQIGEPKIALQSFERFVAEAPPDEQPPQVHHAMAMLRQQLGQSTP
ncbi:MAG: tetratricopeptide repeat protein [Myxococcaceae bacterium]|nr:tetratricopeptide repeat protein [Myxococcaceae bacterium]